jgi:glycosyltransferase involved in cell wall biosynthesis
MSKVLYIVSGRSFTSHAFGRKISEVIKCWKESAKQIDVISGGDSEKNETKGEVEYGAQTYFNKSYRNNKWLTPFIITISEFRDILHDIKFYFKIKSKFISVKHDLVWERSSRLHIAGLLYAKKNKIPFVLEWKDNLVNYPLSLFKPLALLIERCKIQNADFIVVESERLKLFIKRQGIPEDRIFVAYNGVNSNEFIAKKPSTNMIKEKLGLNSDDTLVGYLGSYAFYHSPELLIKSAIISQLSEKHVKYIMVGNGKHYKECIDLAEKYNLINKNVYFIDGVPKEDVPDILNELDITVLPGTTSIICPIKIFEYMSAEKPVLLPDYACNREIITDKVNGLFFDPGNVDDLNQKINLLCNDKVLRFQLSKKARETVINQYSWHETWGKTLNMILDRTGRGT